MQLGRWILAVLFCVAGIALAGCDTPGGSGAARSAPPVLRDAARAVLIGRAYDRAATAVRRQDKAAFLAAEKQLRAWGAAPRAIALARRVAFDAAERAVEQATLYASESYRVGEPQNRQLRAQAAQKYREALRLSPQFASPDPLKSNALGYFLAERGETMADFKQAERLTRDAVQRWDEAIAQTEHSNPEMPRLRWMRAITRDSLAWALFRQKRLDEALEQQKNAVAEGQATARAGGGSGEGLGELHFHLGEIYAALRQPEAARQEYWKALKANPNDVKAARALSELPPLSAEPAPEEDLPLEPPPLLPEPPLEDDELLANPPLSAARPGVLQPVV